jgi:hypothetical protein
MAPAELQLLISIAGMVIFVGLFLALLFSAIAVVGMARLLYLGGRWCMGKIHHHSWSVVGGRTMNAVGRIVPHHQS